MSLLWTVEEGLHYASPDELKKEATRYYGKAYGRPDSGLSRDERNRLAKRARNLVLEADRLEKENEKWQN